MTDTDQKTKKKVEQTLSEVSKLTFRIQNALSHVAESGGDIRSMLGDLRAMAETAEGKSDALAAAGLPKERRRRKKDKPVSALPKEYPSKPAPQGARRRPKWGEIDKRVVWFWFGRDRRLVREGKSADAPRITRRNILHFLAEMNCPKRGAFGLASWRDLGVSMRTPEEVLSCIRSVRDAASRRRK